MGRPFVREALSVSLPISVTMEPKRDVGLSPFAEVVLASDPAEARRFQDQVEQLLLQDSHASPHEVFSIKLALEEALINAIKHGNQMDRAKKVRVLYRVSPYHFEVEVKDEGSGFDPSDVPDPTAVENLERPCGRGLMLMRHYMTEVAYTSTGNCVVMSKVLRNGNK
jgi:serine/threonine-protein kinase RsbW